MGLVAANIVVAWPSTVATIPAGWSRVAELDSRYVVGAATGADADLTTDRGTATHAHTSPAHTPVQEAHTHTVTQTGNSDHNRRISSGSLRYANNVHQHAATEIDPTTAVNASSTITVDAQSNDLEYIEVIWIKSDGSSDVLPVGCVALFASDTLPANWSRVYAGKYLKGAAVGVDGGGTGGANTHAHTSPAHTHEQTSHAHTGYAAMTSDQSLGGGSGNNMAEIGHEHELVIYEEAATNQSVTTTISSSSHEPPHTKINLILSAGASLPYQIICLWIGTHGALPTGWSRYTALDAKWVKAAAAGETGTTGGATQHGHTASDCQPVQDAHSHTVEMYANEFGQLAGSLAGTMTAYSDHYHTFSADSVTVVNNAAAVTINDNTVDSAKPPYRTVIFIQCDIVPGPTTPKPCYTSYDLSLFDAGTPYCERLPEEAHAAWRGDRRHQRQE